MVYSSSLLPEEVLSTYAQLQKLFKNAHNPQIALSYLMKKGDKNKIKIIFHILD